MTSRHCFFKYMREDLRHKLWMVALSVLGNMLVIPVVYLIFIGNVNIKQVAGRGDFANPVYAASVVKEGVRIIYSFFSEYLCIGAAVIALLGAIIVGLGGFRHVFHRNMADTYHSMPIKRRAMFLAGYLNGFLIWFVPFIVMLLFTLILGERQLAQFRKLGEQLPAQAKLPESVLEMMPGTVLFVRTMMSAGVLILAFLLVYHLVLVAVMLCGNVLNALVVTGLLGGGILALYGMFLLFFSYYMDTFLGEAVTLHRQVVYGSPLASSVYLLYLWQIPSQRPAEFPAAVLINLAVAAALGAAAFLLYVRRPSELAEQGLKMKPVKIVLQLLISVIAGMGGWLLFTVITGDLRGTSQGNLGWGIFGAVLAGAVVFGVTDIIFQMDFRAFISHKALMGGSIAVTLLICFAFYRDWMGYDTYLPKQEEIEQIAIYDSRYTGRYYYSYGSEIPESYHPLNRIQIKDSAAAYAFLQTAVKVQNKEAELSEAERYGSDLWGESVLTKVTLTGGRTYYRRYYVVSTDSDDLYALLNTREYRDAVYRIPPEKISAESGFNIRRGDQEKHISADSRKILESICEAYNQDIEENPEILIDGRGRILCQVDFRLVEESDEEEEYTLSCILNVYDSMRHTIEAMRSNGLESAVSLMDPDEVERITLGINHNYASLGEGMDLEKMAESYYEVAAGTAGEGEETSADVSWIPEEAEGSDPVEIVITDPEEIKELLGLVSYVQSRYGRWLFSPAQLSAVTVTDKEGKEYKLYINEGTLPEKYIRRFGWLQPLADRISQGDSDIW